MDLIAALDQTWGSIRELLRSLDPRGWDSPTACSEWSVRDMAAHLGAVEGGFLGFHHYPTTAHPVMQKLAVECGGIETGIMVDYIPAGTEYREIEGGPLEDRHDARDRRGPSLDGHRGRQLVRLRRRYRGRVRTRPARACCPPTETTTRT